MFYCVATALRHQIAHTLRPPLEDTIMRRPYLRLPHFNDTIANAIRQSNFFIPNSKGTAQYAQGMARRRW